METKINLFNSIQVVDRFAIFDIETTGLSCIDDDIIEVAIMRYNTEDIFCSKIFTDKTISSDITAINGITNAMLKNAPSVNTILNNIYTTYSDCILVAHNAHNFDSKFFLSKGGMLFYDFKFLDTKELAKFVFPNFSSYSLYNLCGLFGIVIENQHTATGDTVALNKLFDKLVRLLDKPDMIDKFIKSGSSILKTISKGVMV